MASLICPWAHHIAPLQLCFAPEADPPAETRSRGSLTSLIALVAALAAFACSGVLLWQYRQFYVSLADADDETRAGQRVALVQHGALAARQNEARGIAAATLPDAVGIGERGLRGGREPLAALGGLPRASGAREPEWVMMAPVKAAQPPTE